MIPAGRIFEVFMKGRFSLFLITVVAMFFIMPLLGGDQVLVDQILGWLSILVMLSCMRAISRSRRFFILMAVLSLMNAALTGMEIVIADESRTFLTAVLVVKIIYLVMVFFSIMRFVLNSDPVTGDKVCGALAAYLLMGFIWSMVYTMFYVYDPQSFMIPEEWLTSDTVNSFWAYYFSFTTLTTLGYGDITPQSPPAQSYAVMQAIIGQVFLAVIVARLIALQISHGRLKVEED